MVDAIKAFWHDQIPGWFPVLVAIIGAAFWIGQQQQRISDRLDSVEKQIQDIQEYLRTTHNKADYDHPLSSNKPQISIASSPAKVYASNNDAANPGDLGYGHPSQ